MLYRFAHRIAHQKGGFKRYHMNARKMKNPAINRLAGF